jgi:hypothetical protein
MRRRTVLTECWWSSLFTAEKCRHGVFSSSEIKTAFFPVSFHNYCSLITVHPWHKNPTRTRPTSFLRFLDRKQWHTAVGRTPLDEGSARRRNLCRTANTTLTTDTHPCPRSDFLSLSLSLCTLSLLLCYNGPGFCLLSLLYKNTTQTSMPSAGFEPTISAGERPQTLALDRWATGIGRACLCTCIKKVGQK